MYRLAPLLAALLLATPAWAGDLAVTLATPAGKPVANAVVMVRPQGFAAKAPIRFPWTYRVAQKDLQFDPFMLIVPVGAEVAFPNLDAVRHHVYSFSPAKTFELKLYSRDQTRMVRFEKAGAVGLGCNIHDAMSAFIRVVDTPFAAKSSARGEAVIRDLPPGPATVTVWHPFLKSRGGELVREVTIPASGALRLAVPADLRAPPLRHGGY
jgi:plastocyanin